MSFCLKKALSAGKVLPFSEFAATFLGVCSHLSPAYLITTRESNLKIKKLKKWLVQTFP